MSDPSPPPREAGAGKANGLTNAFSKLDLEGHNLPPSPAPSTPRNGRKYALATELVYTEGSDQYNSSSVPIYQVSASSGTLSLSLGASNANPALREPHGLT